MILAYAHQPAPLPVHHAVAEAQIHTRGGDRNRRRPRFLPVHPLVGKVGEPHHSDDDPEASPPAVLVHTGAHVEPLNGASLTSRAAPSSVRRTITLRAPPAVRISTKYASSPSSWAAPTGTASCAIRSAVMGDLRDPSRAMPVAANLRT